MENTNGKSVTGPTLDELVSNPAKAAALTPATAQALLIGVTALQPLLIQRALSGPRHEPDADNLLTVPEVARRLKISDYRAYELTRQGRLKCVRLGKAVRVREEDLLAYLAQHQT